MGGGKRFLLGAIALALLALGGAVLYVLSGHGGGYDPDFDTAVAAPAYADRGPMVLFDEGHHNVHSSSNGYRPFVELMRNDGYTVQVSDGQITAELLRPANVLVIVGAQGANETNDDPAFSNAEASVISEWVLRGGSLLLVTDHWPFGAAAAPLAERFGIEMSKGMTEDPGQAEPGLGPSHIIYDRAAGSLADHAITRGRNPHEQVSRLLTHTGQSLRGPADGVSLLVLSSQARDLPPTAPEIRREGGDVIVTMNYGEPVSAAGRAQAVAVNFGRGRVVVLGEAAMLRAYLDDDGQPFGMNRPGYDNRQFALNLMHWLSGLI